MPRRVAWCVVVLCAGLTLLCGCPPKGGAGGAVGKNGATAGAAVEAGIDFHRKDVGLPVTTLDYIGDSPLGLAGARDSGQLFYAVQGKSDPELYMRDPATMERKMLGQIPQLEQGSLAASADGKYVVYCRQRDSEKYIDDPNITYPKQVAVVTRFDVESAKEDTCYDFKTAPFLEYRNNELSPNISRDGGFIATVSYNMERLTKAKMLSDWLALDSDYRERSKKMKDSEKKETEDSLRQLLANADVKKYLTGHKVSVADTGTPTEEERTAIKQYFNEMKDIETVLLLWEDGQSRVLPITLPESYKGCLSFIISAERDIVLIWPQPLVPNPAVPQELFRIDLKTGAATKVCEFLGMPSTFELSEDKTKLNIVYNPTDLEKKEVTTTTKLMTCSVDGSGTPVEVDLQADYLGYIDLVQDGTYVVGQDQDSHDLILANSVTGTKHIQLELQNAVTGIFIDKGLQHAVFLDTGILYSIPLSETPEQAEGYIESAYFDQFRADFIDSLTTLGFTVPADIKVQYEEREGLKTHEVSVQIVNPAKPDSPVLMRYSLVDKRVVALWFPRSYAFENTMLKESTKPLDYYEIQKRADKILDALGWLNPETRSIYQPGSNPLFDGRTDSYILLYRDGYWYDEKAKDKWIINSEVTLRLLGKSGDIAELSISTTDPIRDQPITLSLDQALFNIRNREEAPIPEDAPVRWDTDNLRYVIDMASEDLYGPGKYSEGKKQRICYEIDAYIKPEDELITSYHVDAETGDVLGQLDFQPTSLAGLTAPGVQ
jgi:hypothetical protein